MFSFLLYGQFCVEKRWIIDSILALPMMAHIDNFSTCFPIIVIGPLVNKMDKTDKTIRHKPIDGSNKIAACRPKNCLGMVATAKLACHTSHIPGDFSPVCLRSFVLQIWPFYGTTIFLKTKKCWRPRQGLPNRIQLVDEKSNSCFLFPAEKRLVRSTRMPFLLQASLYKSWKTLSWDVLDSEDFSNMFGLELFYYRSHLTFCSHRKSCGDFADFHSSCTIVKAAFNE